MLASYRSQKIKVLIIVLLGVLALVSIIPSFVLNFTANVTNLATHKQQIVNKYPFLPVYAFNSQTGFLQGIEQLLRFGNATFPKQPSVATALSRVNLLLGDFDAALGTIKENPSRAYHSETIARLEALSVLNRLNRCLDDESHCDFSDLIDVCLRFSNNPLVMFFTVRLHREGIILCSNSRQQTDLLNGWSQLQEDYYMSAQQDSVTKNDNLYVLYDEYILLYGVQGLLIGQNLIRNASFESDADNWILHNQSRIDTEIWVDDSAAYIGESSAVYRSDQQGYNAGIWQIVPIQPGAMIAAGSRVFVSEGEKHIIESPYWELYPSEYDNPDCCDHGVQFQGESTDWNRLMTISSIPSESSRSHIAFFVANHFNEGVARVDDAFLYLLPPNPHLNNNENKRK